MSDKSVTYYKDSLDIPDTVRTMQTVHGHNFEEPFYICDLSEIVNKFIMWKRILPRIIPYYAVKCNTYAPLLTMLAELGIGFDCASGNEIVKIQALGVLPNRIVFANPVKRTSELLYARKHGIKRMTFDNECELHRVKKLFPDAELILRIRCDAKKAWFRGLGEKYGCDPKIEAFELIQSALSLNMKVIGISFHVGSGCLDYGTYFKAIATARKIFDLSEKIGNRMTLLDIGGGFISDVQAFSEVAKVINQALSTFFPSNDVTVIAEPGRYFASAAFTLVTKVINVKEARNNGKPSFAYTINCGIHAGFRYLLFGRKLTRPEVIRETNEEKYKCTIWGPTCDPADKLYEDIRLPKLQVDDVLIFRNFGAYSTVLATNFNGFEMAEIKPYLNVKHENLNQQTEWDRQTIIQ
ncbi:unnamed protein product [Hermetia illucens]|uniref:ornithine decarboxylase n=1 Tax=Hermetia illucens TaxID=343691 RepID=A0A7R8YX00_HERIL|nr:ornithine decarboxylase 2-like [Hermetia illucens]CAD7087905.1 unnamed protein product [Hermetia illucens]